MKRSIKRFTCWAGCIGLLWTAACAGTPPAEHKQPDLSGVWLATSPRSVLNENRPALTPRAQADLKGFDPLKDPVIRCVTPGFPRSGLAIYPFEIVQTDKMLVFLYESFGMVRRIYMDGRQPPDYFPPGRMGYSLGRWEGNDLVIETTHLEEGLLDGAGLRQYGDVSVVERYRTLDDGHALEAEVMITAPETFTAAWTRRFTWERDPKGIVYESVCDPADSRF
ncbi:MAG TPA: hypothetical protein VFY29_05205 [Terriglobia bacterium]|nr:hypothetical protein [Terriglobia bacterium]